MPVSHSEVKKGDIIIYSASNPVIDLCGHSVIVSRSCFPVKVFEATSGGFTRTSLWQIRRSLKVYNQQSCVYRLNASNLPPGQVYPDYLGAKAASIGNLWIHQPDCQFLDTTTTNEVDACVDGVYGGNFTALYAYASSPVFTTYTARYVEYLQKECQYNPPRELLTGSRKIICTYIPIALYQAAIDNPLIAKLVMGIDPFKSIPRDLAKYLNKNQYWVNLGSYTG